MKSKNLSFLKTTKSILFILTGLLLSNCTQKESQDVKAEAKNFIEKVISSENGLNEYSEVWTINDKGEAEPPIPTRLLKDLMKHYDVPKATNYHLLYADKAYRYISETRTTEYSEPIVWVNFYEAERRPSLMMIYKYNQDSTLQYSKTVLRTSYPKETEDPNARILDFPSEPFYFDPESLHVFYTHLYLETGNNDFYTVTYQPELLKEPVPEFSRFLSELNNIKIDSAFMSHGYPNRVEKTRYGIFQFELKTYHDYWALSCVIKSDSGNKDPLSEYIQLHKYDKLDRVQVYLLRKDDHEELISRIEEVFYTNNVKQELPRSIFEIEN